MLGVKNRQMNRLQSEEEQKNLLGGEKDIIFYDVRKEPFKIYGLYDYKNQKTFKRLPDDVAEASQEGVQRLYHNTSGGRVRFCTNSCYIVIKALFPSITPKPHMSLLGTSGFDIYLDHNNGSNSSINS